MEGKKKIKNTEDSIVETDNIEEDEVELLEIYSKIDKAKQLSKIMNVTIDRDEFINSLVELKEILNELIKYEEKYEFDPAPSKDLEYLESVEKEQIELLEKRIAEKEKETIKALTSATDSNTKNNHYDYYERIAKQKENNLQITYDDVECYDLTPFDLNKPFISDGHFTLIELEGENLEKAYGYLQMVHNILMPFKNLFESAIFPEKISTGYDFGDSKDHLPTSHLRLQPYTATKKENKYPFYLWLSFFGYYGTEYIYMIYFNQDGEIGKADLNLHGSNGTRLSYESKIRRNENGLYVMRINKTLYVEPYGTKIIYHYKDDENFQKDNNDSVEEKNIKEVIVEKETIEEAKKEKIEENSAPIEENLKPLEEKPKIFEYIFPSVFLLDKKQDSENYIDEIKQRGGKLAQTFSAFGVNAEIVDILSGTRFTRFEIQIGKGVRIKDILKIKDDIKLNLEAANLHIEAPIPGKTTIGIDVENKEVSIVAIREMIESKEFQENLSDLAVAIGKDLVGNTIVKGLDDMCHLLIGGTTGSGKSVCINSMIMSILYKASPESVKLIMIDTKAINLSIYNGIPHLLIPVVTELRKSTGALNWAVAEMMDRYRKFANYGAKDLTGYNKAIEKYSSDDEPSQKIPRIVIIIDDFSDLMITDNSGTEESICRLAQMGRAAGIHLVISTQRPSVDVITGIIKANIPSRIAFNVFSAIDSRTILDTKGAEDLLLDGDMLFYPQGIRTPLRVQGTYVSDREIDNVIDFIKSQMVGYYDADYKNKAEQPKAVSNVIKLDEYFSEAGRFVIEHEKASIGMLQRMFKIGFNRAARIMDQLSDAGVVGPEEGTKPRMILMSIEEFERYIEKR